jgi:hypothetical protein
MKRLTIPLLVVVTGALLAVSALPARAVTGAISTTDPTQKGRLFRDGTPSTCAVPKVSQSAFDTTPYFFDSYTFTNATGASECLAVTLTSLSSGCDIFSAAYLGTFDPASIETNYLADAGASVAGDSPTTTTTNTRQYSFTLDPGQTAVVTVNDTTPGGVGNCASYTLDVAPANTPPTVTIFSVTPAPNGAGNIEGNTTGGATVSFAVTSTDPEDIPDPAADCSDGTNPVDPAGTFFALGGPYTITCSATDTGGASGQDTLTFSVVDTTAPVLSNLPPDQTVPATGPAGAPVTFTPATATDIVDPSVAGACTRSTNGGAPVAVSSGDTFPIGQSVVTCTFTDDSGNASSDSFVVNVVGKPRIVVNDAKTVVEPNTGTRSMVFVVRLDHAYTQNVAVHFATANGSAVAGSDYVAKSGTLTFSPGQTSKSVVVQIKGDTRHEPNEVLYLLLSNPQNASIGDGNAAGGIIDND